MGLFTKENKQKEPKAPTLDEQWTPTQKITAKFEIDEVNKKWCVKQGMFKYTVVGIYDYSDILEYDLEEDGTNISGGGLGRAAVGGLVFGGVGAIVGGVTGGKKQKTIVKNLQVKIVTRNASKPIVRIPLLITKTKSGSLDYRFAYDEATKIMATLAQIVDQMESENSSLPESNNSAADEIRKFKNLMDEGVISEEEFNAKKKELLGL